MEVQQDYKGKRVVWQTAKWYVGPGLEIEEASSGKAQMVLELQGRMNGVTFEVEVELFEGWLKQQCWVMFEVMA